MIEAVSELTKSVVVPLVAAGIAALGIALPLILFRRQELAKAEIQSKATDDSELKRQIERVRNDAFLLRELVQRFGLEEVLTSSQQQVVESARDRMFKMIYFDVRLFNSIIPEDLRSPRRVKKLMLMFGELESRLASSFTPEKASDPVMLFGIYTLCYLLETDAEEKAEDFNILKLLAEQDRDTDGLFKALYGT